MMEINKKEKRDILKHMEFYGEACQHTQRIRTELKNTLQVVEELLKISESEQPSNQI
jgi:hypothetical protein